MSKFYRYALVIAWLVILIPTQGLTADETPPKKDETILSALPEAENEVKEDWSARALILADIERNIGQLRHHISDPQWRAQFATFLFRGIGWSFADVIIAFLTVKSLDRIGRRFFRAGRVHRLLKRLMHVVILLLTVMVIFRAWGADSLAWMASELGQRLGALALVAMGALALWEWMNAAIDRFVHRLDASGQPVERSARILTLIPLLRNIALATLVILLTLTVLSEAGVNIAPLLAVSGVIGVALGFGSQKLVQDMITGMFLLIEDAVVIGDSVKIGDHAGVVEGMTIRTLRLRDASGQLHTIPFGNISLVTNLSRDVGYFLFELPLAPECDVTKVTASLTELIAAMRSDPAVGADMRDVIELNGIEKLTASAAVYTGRIKTKPGRQGAVGCVFNQRVLERFAADGIAFAKPAQTVFIKNSG